MPCNVIGQDLVPALIGYFQRDSMVQFARPSHFSSPELVVRRTKPLSLVVGYLCGVWILGNRRNLLKGTQRGSLCRCCWFSEYSRHIIGYFCYTVQ